MHRLELVILLIARGAFAQCATYSAQYVSGPDCGIFGTEGALAWGLAHNGAVCGEYNNCNDDTRAFFWPVSGGLQPIALPTGFTDGRAFAVNAAGVTVGRMTTPGSGIPYRAFIAVAGSASDLGLLPGANTAEALSINSTNVVVGYSQNTVAGPLRAFWWQNGTMSQINVTLGPASVADDINDTNQVCGWMGIHPVPTFGATPFVWQAGKTTPLPLPAYALNASGEATALNDLGDACGYFFVGADPWIRRACAWISGQFVDLGVFPGQVISYALDINDAREIVGYCQPSFQGPLTAFIWRNGVMTNLNTITQPGSPFMRVAHAINNTGQITGEGIGPENLVALLLTPAPPAHAGDTNCDNHVNVDDLLSVILSWNPQGPVGGNPADLNRDNRINVDDLLAVLLHWG